MYCGLILAGGRGTRFWPISTEQKPKQFVKILGDKTMLQLTVDRMRRILPLDSIFILTAPEYVYLVKEQIKGIKDENIIIQPYIKNTAPALILSILTIENIKGPSQVVVVPSDHQIGNEEKQGLIIEKGLKFANENSEAIITIGINPSRPETGYGYIKSLNEINIDNVCIVDKFVEKPQLPLAIEYFKSGKYLWNSGIFIFNSSNFLEISKKYVPSIYFKLKDVFDESSPYFREKMDQVYKEIDEISVDKGLIEKYDQIYVIPSDFGWDDIGSWTSVERYKGVDSNKNIIVGKVDNIKNDENYVMSFDTCTEKKIVLLGLKNVFVIDSNDVLIVGDRSEIENIAELRNEMLKKSKI